MAPLPFTKMHGAGNDFVMLDGRVALPIDAPTAAVKFCDRHFGIGADGLIIVDQGSNADCRMTYYNASDGSRSVCGNGLRCVARYAYTRGWVPRSKTTFSVDTGNGVSIVQVAEEGALVTVDMGSPIFEGDKIPVAASGEHLQKDLEVGGTTVRGACVSMGNPHYVVFVDDVQSADVLGLGPKLEHHPFFPKRTNVEFVQIVDQNTLCIRIWERGVGETLACGTGACAVAAAAVRTRGFGRNLRVQLPGGEFSLSWDSDTNRISLTGPAAEVFCGEIDYAPNERVTNVFRNDHSARHAI